MPFVPECAGPTDPLLGTPPRRAASIRRTTSIDTTRGEIDVVTRVDARARDVLTGVAGAVRPVARQQLAASLDLESAAIESLDATPRFPGLDRLLGQRVGPGFRGVVLERLPDMTAGSLLATLLDDWAGAQLVSGYALQRSWRTEDEPGPTQAPPAHLLQMSDICAGWESSATIMVTIGRTGTVPTPLGPVIPTRDADEDDVAWHEMPALRPGSTRRRRRIDLWVEDGDSLSFETHFRDSYGEDAETQSVLHEYLVHGTVGRRDLAVRSITADALVLPWQECPAAVGSAARLVGTTVSGLRPLVRGEFTGTSTCTHLNDTLRSLEDVVVLAGELERSVPSV
jgi:hypothetical protein